MPGIISGLFGGDNGIVQTAQAISKLVYAALRDPDQAIRRKAESIIRGLPDHDDTAEIPALFSYVQSVFHYVGDPVDIEYVKSPQVIDGEVDNTGAFQGDCDDAVCYLSALLKSIGYNVVLVVTAPSESAAGIPTNSNEYTHIFLRVLMNDGTWLGLDPTAKDRPIGWETPSNRERTIPLY